MPLHTHVYAYAHILAISQANRIITNMRADNKTTKEIPLVAFLRTRRRRGHRRCDNGDAMVSRTGLKFSAQLSKPIKKNG